MAFFKSCTIAALMFLSVSVVASSVAEVPSSSPSSSPSSDVPSEEEKALDGQYILEKMNVLKNRMEEFISKDIEEWRNDSTSNSHVCLNTCKVVYNFALFGLNVAIESISAGNDFTGATGYLSNCDTNIGTCNDCFNEMTESFDTSVNRPDSVGNFSDFALALTKQCFTKFAKYRPKDRIY